MSARHDSERGCGPAYADGSCVVGYFTISGSRIERIAPAGLPTARAKAHHFVPNGCRCHVVCMTCDVVKLTGTPSLAPCGASQ